jgi:hypothetical protein
MGSISKGFLLFVIVILAVSTLTIVKPTWAQVGVTNPSVPEFSVQYETYTRNIPPTYGVDPSTGKAVITKAGYTEIEKWVRIVISNQPFIPYNDTNGNYIQLFYDARWKGHLDTTWESIPDGIWFTQLSDSPRTGISIGFKGYKGGADLILLDPADSQLDFQVEASIGYYTADNVFIGETSGWSNTQTLTIGESQTPTPSPATPTPTPTPSQEPQQTEQIEPIVGAAIVVAVIIAVLGLLIYLIKRK